MNGFFWCKFISLCFCCLASYNYAQPVLVFYPDWIRILIPSFLSGYIIVNLAEMITIAMGDPHIFIEMVFAGIGFGVSLICGIFEMYQWTSWFTDVIDDTKTMGWQELLLAFSCLFNATVLMIDFVRYVFQWPLQNSVEDSDN